MNNGVGEPSGCLGGASLVNSLARKFETTQYNTAKLNQPSINTAASMHRDTAREKVVNTIKRHVEPSGMRGVQTFGYACVDCECRRA